MTRAATDRSRARYAVRAARSPCGRGRSRHPLAAVFHGRSDARPRRAGLRRPIGRRGHRKFWSRCPAGRSPPAVATRTAGPGRTSGPDDPVATSAGRGLIAEPLFLRVQSAGWAGREDDAEALVRVAVRRVVPVPNPRATVRSRVPVTTAAHHAPRAVGPLPLLQSDSIDGHFVPSRRASARSCRVRRTQNASVDS